MEHEEGWSRRGVRIPTSNRVIVYGTYLLTYALAAAVLFELLLAAAADFELLIRINFYNY